MAKQFSATIQGQSVSFPSSLVRIVGLAGGSNIEYLGSFYLADESASDLINSANTDGTEQVSATILRVNDAVQTSPIIMGFPASLISIYTSSLSGSQSVIVYNGDFYYAEESQTALEDAANTASDGGGWGTSGTIATLTGDGIVDLNGHELAFTTNGWEVAISPDEGYALLVNDGVQDLLLIDPVNHVSIIRANNDGDNSVAQLLFGSDSGGDGVYFNLGLNAGSGDTKIIGDGVAKSITYTADTHTFNGDMILADLAGGGTTGLSIDDTGKIIRTP